MTIVNAVYGGGGGITPPSKGFVPNQWNSSGRIIGGTWYGTVVPKGFFYRTTSNLFFDLVTVLFNGDVTEFEENSFCSNGNLCLTSLPPTLKRIGVSALNGCFNVSISYIPSGVIAIGQYAFRNCSGLISLTFGGTPDSINSEAFSNCSNITTINVPWSEGEVSGAPWGATNATINYDYVPS